jgi:hypothetical protein
MVKLEVYFEDATELGAFAEFMEKVEHYRQHKPPHSHHPVGVQGGPVAPEDNSAEEVSDATYDDAPPEVLAHQVPADTERLTAEAPVIATITPEGVSKPPTDEQLNSAAQAYAKKHGLEKALDLVRQTGATRVGELKDPAKRAELYKRFVEGVK